MPIFISYSHSDKSFVDDLAINLVKNNVHVWVDTWELNIGDSIINKIQSAIQESTALLVVLSKASINSEWCKKELSSGLMRELDEKKVVVLPVLLEDCDIPLFLRDKKYADFIISQLRSLVICTRSGSIVYSNDYSKTKNGVVINNIKGFRNDPLYKLIKKHGQLTIRNPNKFKIGQRTFSSPETKLVIFN